VKVRLNEKLEGKQDKNEELKDKLRIIRENKS